MSPPAPTESGLREGVNPFLIAIVVGMAAFMEVLDISIANVSLRNIAGSLSAGQEESTWVLTSYLVANAIVLPMSGWFSMLFGRKRFYILSIILFTISSMLCGLSSSLGMLIVFRVVQGLGGGALQPVSQAILSDAFPPEKRGMAFAIYGMSVVFAPAIGPTVGGWITDNYSWHWIFLINVPVGILLVLLSRFLLSDPPAVTEARKVVFSETFKIDYLGFGLIALGLGALQIVLDKGQQEDWLQSSFIAWMSLVSASALVFALYWEWRHPHPVMNLRLMRDRNFALGWVLMFMLGFVLLGSTLLLPLMTQTLLGYPPTQAGMVISPGGFTVMCLMPVAGLMVTRVDVRKPIFFGMMTVCLSMFYMTTLDMTVDYKTLVLARIFQMVGIAFLFIPLNTAAFAGVPEGESGNASALFNLSRNIGSSVGISVLSTALARGTQVHQSHLVDRITPLDPVYSQSIQELTQKLGSPEAAQGMVYGMVQRHAAMLSYIDDFWFMGICTLVLVPLVFLLRRVEPGKSPLAAH
jgi:DHA2 family multidrug resistance protein